MLSQANWIQENGSTPLATVFFLHHYLIRLNLVSRNTCHVNGSLVDPAPGGFCGTQLGAIAPQIEGGWTKAANWERRNLKQPNYFHTSYIWLLIQLAKGQGKRPEIGNVMNYTPLQQVFGPSLRVPRYLPGGSKRPVRQQLYVRKFNDASKDLPVKLLNELNWKGKEKTTLQCKQLPHSLDVERGFYQLWVRWWEVSSATSIPI